MKDSEARQRQAPSVAHMHVLLQYSPAQGCYRANQCKDTGKAPLQWEVMGLYTFPWTGHPFPAHTTLVVPQIPSVPLGCRFCCPVGVPRASFTFYSCLTLLPAGVFIGNNEAGENETPSKCTSCNESVSVTGRFLCVLPCTGTVATMPSSPWGCRLWAQQQRHLKVHVRDPQLKLETIPLPCSHLSSKELLFAQSITLEGQSGSTFKAKISVLKDAIKQSQGRVYREQWSS